MELMREEPIAPLASPTAGLQEGGSSSERAPRFRSLQEIYEVTENQDDLTFDLEILENNPDIDRNETLGQFVSSHGYSICSIPSEGAISFSASSVLSFFHSHYLYQLFGSPQWLAIKGQYYVKMVKQELESRGCRIRTSCEVHKISTNEAGCTVLSGDGSEEVYSRCILAVHAPDAMGILADQATSDELRVLGAFQYLYSDIFLHRDENLMPQNQAAWSAFNFIGSKDHKVCLTYWLNALQELEFCSSFLFFVCFQHTARRDAKRSVSKSIKKSLRGWWTPLLFTASISSAIYFFQHVSRQNTITQARRNISCHYDLSNELFALFLGEKCDTPVTKDEYLNSGQKRKISILIEKARIQKKHEVLEIGCGWGVFAIELVKQTGCKYTGITLSEEQLKFEEKKVADAGLQDHIKFLLCDCLQLPDTSTFDRIISCEMLEHVGHDKMNDFFGCCESVLAEDGIFVLQFTSLPDERYEEHIRSSDFIKEYTFPRACVPPLSRVTSAMAAASRFCEILALGFDEKFIRTWEYYFDYSAAEGITLFKGQLNLEQKKVANAGLQHLAVLHNKAFLLHVASVYA
ncbi:hypothetical protein FEM48_Zijuj07G0095400 [Ziziphus jujuba var. spinosa]|uniref:Amine oxidase domain-containing protein n=1 Tax=Ziziphus jujuba var. spinosa TaxID=714518 RepID=A0A978V3V4_ZIZJJ|nr:hypothetical protein FEM48_Zijuj07G0095400 [Ziziphus jujuba var. spinosa]